MSWWNDLNMESINFNLKSLFSRKSISKLLFNWEELIIFKWSTSTSISVNQYKREHTLNISLVLLKIQLNVVKFDIAVIVKIRANMSRVIISLSFALLNFLLCIKNCSACVSYPFLIYFIKLSKFLYIFNIRF